jgi:hypothetical protein
LQNKRYFIIKYNSGAGLTKFPNLGGHVTAEERMKDTDEDTTSVRPAHTTEAEQRESARADA